MKGIKNLLTNRNAVTILAVLAGVIVLWVVYNMTLTKAISPVKVPIAKQDITAGTLITADMLEYTEVSSDFLRSASVITTSGRLINYYVNRGTSIPKGDASKRLMSVMTYFNQIRYLRIISAVFIAA